MTILVARSRARLRLAVELREPADAALRHGVERGWSVVNQLSQCLVGVGHAQKECEYPLSDLIKKLPPNSKGQVRYRFVVDVGVDPATGKRRQLTRTFATLKEAKVEYARITNRRQEGAFVPPKQITLNEWLDRWLAMKAVDLEETTIYNYRVTLDRVRGKLGHIQLQELTEEDVEEWMHWALRYGRARGGKAGTPLGVTSVEMSLARLKDALNRAVTRRLLTVNVAQHVSIPRRARKEDRKKKQEVKPWNVQEVQAFIHGIKAEWLYAPPSCCPSWVCDPLKSADFDGRTSTWTMPRSP